MYQTNYKTQQELKEFLLYKKIIKWNENELIFDDGSIATIECSEQDCCADAGGSFNNVALDAVITDVVFSDIESEDDWGTTINSIAIKILHNQNLVAQANCYADDGNGGYYYSVCSVVINKIHYKVVEA